jgi:soluble lytic murein transglycosylase-like protein
MNWEKEYKSVIKENCKKETATGFNLEPALVYAIIKVESNGNTLAYNPEGRWVEEKWQGFWSKYMKNNPAYRNHPLEKYICLNGAFGLMQILAVRAMELGFGRDSDPSGLWQPEVGIYYGCLNLKILMDRYKGNIWDVVAAYNQGNIRKYSSGPHEGKYCNYQYVEKVMEFYVHYKEELKE